MRILFFQSRPSFIRQHRRNLGNLVVPLGCAGTLSVCTAGFWGGVSHFSALYRTVHALYCTRTVLYTHCTVLYTRCTVHALYCTVHALYCTVHALYCTVHALYSYLRRGSLCMDLQGIPQNRLNFSRSPGRSHMPSHACDVMLLFCGSVMYSCVLNVSQYIRVNITKQAKWTPLRLVSGL